MCHFQCRTEVISTSAMCTPHPHHHHYPSTQSIPRLLLICVNLLLTSGTEQAATWRGGRMFPWKFWRVQQVIGGKQYKADNPVPTLLQMALICDGKRRWRCTVLWMTSSPLYRKSFMKKEKKKPLTARFKHKRWDEQRKSMHVQWNWGKETKIKTNVLGVVS